MGFQPVDNFVHRLIQRTTLGRQQGKVEIFALRKNKKILLKTIVYSGYLLSITNNHGYFARTRFLCISKRATASFSKIFSLTAPLR